MAVSAPAAAQRTTTRSAAADNLKVVLVVGVILGHATIAWTGMGEWVLEEPHLREPLLSVVLLLGLVGGMFAMALFFFLAGWFTPRSLQRKGLRRFLLDRLLRLGVPMAFFVLVLSPPIEYVDPDSSSWTRGFLAFVPHIWWPPAPGPTWFLGVLLVFSAGYAVVRTMRPRGEGAGAPLRVRWLALVVVAVTAASYVVRLAVPFGEERWRLALGQSPGWVAGFTLGVLAAERRWLDPVDPRIALIARRVAWAGAVYVTLLVVVITVFGYDVEVFGGHGSWQSLLAALGEGVLVVAMPLWLVDLFRRRFDHQSPLAHELGRAAFAAFVVHQPVLVGAVLAVRQVAWPREVEYVTAAGLAVVASFALGWLLVGLPGVRRVLGDARPAARLRGAAAS